LQKIFGIGLNKTGTKSLTAACEQLGFRTLHSACRIGDALQQNLRQHRRPLESLEDYDAYFDMGFWVREIPYSDLLQRLDESYPGSKFIFHTRGVDSWIQSLREHNDRYNTRSVVRRLLTGRKPRRTGVEWEIAARRRHEHCEEVARGYFRQRSGALLIFDVTSGDGWERLCRFLGMPIPVGADGQPIPFPYRGKKDERPIYGKRLYRLKRLLWQLEKQMRGQ
jgi:hypothetical protein